MRASLFALTLSLLPSMGDAALLEWDEALPFEINQADETWPIFQKVTEGRFSSDPWAKYHITHAIHDLNGDGVNEIIFRFDGRSACEGTSCPMIVAEYRGGEWLNAGEFFAYTVWDVPSKNDENPWANLVVRENIDRFRPLFRYARQGDRYALDLTVYGDEIALEPVGEEFAEILPSILSRDVPETWLLMRSSRNAGDRVVQGKIDLNGDGGDETILRLEHASVCSNSGCPVLIYDELNKGAAFIILSDRQTQMVAAKDRSGERLRSILLHRGGQVATYSYDAAAQTYVAREN